MSGAVRIALIGVHYRSPQALEWFVDSLPRDAGRFGLRAIVVDNSAGSSPAPVIEGRTVEVLAAPRNAGYFGGAAWGLARCIADGERPDWVIVSNVDLAFAPDFFAELSRTEPGEDIGVLAPSIETERNRFPENPFLETRPSLGTLQLYRLLYRSVAVYSAYERLGKIRRWLLGSLRAHPDGGRERDIYAPHGACVIFSSNYFRRGGTLDYPGFLYGEEGFVAEEARRLGLRIRYAPRLKVVHRHQASTGRVPNREKIGYFRRSAEYLHRRIAESGKNQ